MTEPIDNLDQEIACLLDGTLDEPRRRRLLEHLANDEESYKVYAAALQLVDSGHLTLAERPSDGEVVPFPGTGGPVAADASSVSDGSGSPEEPFEASPKGHRRFGRSLAAVLALFAAGLAFLFIERNARMNGSTESEVFSTALLGNLDFGTRLGANWQSPIVFRGGPGPDLSQVEASRTSFELGTRLLRLDLALGLGKTEVGRGIAQEIAERLEATSLLGSPETYRELARALEEPGGGAGALERSRDAERRLQDLVDRYLDSEALALGRWVEAGRLAASVGDGEYFESPAFRQPLEGRGEAVRGALGEDYDEVLRLTDGTLEGPELADLELLFERVLRSRSR